MKIRLLKPIVTFAILCVTLALPMYAESGIKDIGGGEAIEAGKAGFGMKDVFSAGIKQSEARVHYAPKADIAVLEFSYQSVKTRLYFSRTARSQYIESVSEYQKEYDARSLNVRAKKTDRKYGATETKVEWGTSFAMNKYAKPKMRFGYVFVDRQKPRPYFTVSLQSAANLGEQIDAIRTDDESVSMVLYFTKNQAAELGELLMQENLDGILKDRGYRDYTDDPDDYEN